MTYEQAVASINGRLKFGIKPGLERISALLERLGNPQENLSFVHIAGTNGKGSVAVMLQSILTASGKKTGLFTSPYIVNFTERFRIDGLEISQDELARLTERITPFADQIDQLTEFEFITALALLWFYEQECDVVVLEVGLGGRFDSTNVIGTPLAAVITSISIDHTNILGSTIAQIAREKCGIIKPHGLVVSAAGQHPEALTVIMESVANTGGRLVLPGTHEVVDVLQDWHGTHCVVAGIPVTVPLSGEFQIQNIQLAVHTALALGLSESSITEGLKRVRHPARFEVLHQDPLVLLDGAHNKDGGIALRRSLEQLAQGRPVVAVMGVLGDKQVEEMTSVLCPVFKHVICVEPNNLRAMIKEELCALSAPFCKASVSSQKTAVNKALALLPHNGILLICGSLYLCSDLRKDLQNLNKISTKYN